VSHATATQGGAARSGDVHAALASPVRQRLLELLRASGTPTDAHQLAQTVGLHVTTVRFHLEVLRRAGLLVRSPQPQPRVGRPRTVYAPVSAEADDTATGYQGLAGLLATHLSDTAEGRAARAEQAGLAWAEQLVPTALQSEPTVADAARQMNELFAEIGFDPELTTVSGGWQIALRACPFRAVARAQPEVVCSVHAGLLRGSLDRLGVSATSRLVPFVQPELCFAQLAPRSGT
jgi:predicted ArsR family transcriptional regulator